MDNKIIQLPHIKSSLYSRFMSNAITASPNVQKNFLDVTKSVADTIRKQILSSILNINQLSFGLKIKIKLLVSLMGELTKLQY